MKMCSFRLPIDSASCWDSTKIFHQRRFALDYYEEEDLPLFFVGDSCLSFLFLSVVHPLSTLISQNIPITLVQSPPHPPHASSPSRNEKRQILPMLSFVFQKQKSSPSHWTFMKEKSHYKETSRFLLQTHTQSRCFGLS